MKPRVIKPKVANGGGLSGAETTERASALLQKQKEQEKKNSEGPQVGIAPEEVGVLPSQVGDNMTVGGYRIPSDDDIVWSSTDDPDADIAFDKPFLKPQKRGGSWEDSYTNARRESMRTNKPVVMWFTNEGPTPSPICKILSREVFARKDFGAWAKDNVVRLKVDLSGGSSDRGSVGDLATRKRKYVAQLKKKFSVLGCPTVIVLQPDGSVYNRYRGYKKGQGPSYWRELKDAVLTINHNQRIWRQKMAAKGYRSWKGKNDQVIFARLARYSAGVLTLIEPNGSKIQTKESLLSSADRKWLEAEKKKRGL
ncbi:hypothetical protein N9Z83_00560 [Akkermansiaceae bacterium]|nr:hypothetical protein [Akkermansiaceae bacterium]